MNVPTEDDWRSEPWTIDTPYAYEHFQGKTIAEAVLLFEENALLYQEDVMFMPSRVFGYYLKAYCAYLRSDAAVGDSDGASCFIALIQFKSETDPDDLVPLWPDIEPVLATLANHQNFFDADWAVYGSFRARIHEIVERGFAVSFDTEIEEAIPDSVSIADMVGSPRQLPLRAAVPIFHNEGIREVDATSTKPDILRIFGQPARIGGGEESAYGHVPEWAHYYKSDAIIRFEFDGDSVSSVVFLPSWAEATPAGVDPEVREIQEALRGAWEVLFGLPPRPEVHEDETGSN